MFKKLDKSYSPKLIAEAMEDDSNESSNMVDALVKCLSCAKVLSQRAHAYHWNYVGQSFAELHEVFGNIYDQLSVDVDELAERIRALNAIPPSSLSDMVRNSTIDDLDSNLSESGNMVSKLTDGFEQYKECLSSALETAANNNDDGSVDLLSEKLKNTEKTIWMLKSTK